MLKYVSDEERTKAYKEQQNNYSMKEWKCDFCDCIIRLGNKTHHLNTKKHLKNVYGNNDIQNECLKKTWKCEDCDIEIHPRSKENHLKSKRHLRNNSSICSDNDSI
jgi:hypothetical protein